MRCRLCVLVLRKVGETGTLGAGRPRRGGGGGLHPRPVPAGTPGGDAPLAVVSMLLDSPAQDHPLPSSYPSFVKGNFQSILFLCLFFFNLRI